MQAEANLALIATFGSLSAKPIFALVIALHGTGCNHAVRGQSDRTYRQPSAVRNTRLGEFLPDCGLNGFLQEHQCLGIILGQPYRLLFLDVALGIA